MREPLFMPGERCLSFLYCINIPITHNKYIRQQYNLTWKSSPSFNFTVIVGSESAAKFCLFELCLMGSEWKKGWFGFTTDDAFPFVVSIPAASQMEALIGMFVS